MRQIFTLLMICTLPACTALEPGPQDHSVSAHADAVEENPREFEGRVSSLEHGMSIDEVIGIFGKPRMDTNLGDGQRILSFAKIYEGGRIRTISLSFQDGELNDTSSSR